MGERITHISTNVNFDIILAANSAEIAEIFDLLKSHFKDPLLKQDLFDLDETETHELMQSEAEAELKHTVWKELNRNYLVHVLSKRKFELSDYNKITYQYRPSYQQIQNCSS